LDVQWCEPLRILAPLEPVPLKLPAQSPLTNMNSALAGLRRSATPPVGLAGIF